MVSVCVKAEEKMVNKALLICVIGHVKYYDTV